MDPFKVTLVADGSAIRVEHPMDECNSICLSLPEARALVFDLAHAVWQADGPPVIERFPMDNYAGQVPAMVRLRLSVAAARQLRADLDEMLQVAGLPDWHEADGWKALHWADCLPVSAAVKSAVVSAVYRKMSDDPAIIWPVLAPAVKAEILGFLAHRPPRLNLEKIGCCALAVRRFCVCRLSIECPTHGCKCWGTHD